MADPLYLSLWFPSFEEPEILPRAVSVLGQFPFSPLRGGVTYVAVHPVSWNEPTILEQRFDPGVAPEEAAGVAADLVHEDYAYVFEADWDLWSLPEDAEQWALVPARVSFIVKERNLTRARRRRPDTSRLTWDWTRRFCTRSFR
jgi:hypothetical protein